MLCPIFARVYSSLRSLWSQRSFVNYAGFISCLLALFASIDFITAESYTTFSTKSPTAIKNVAPEDHALAKTFNPAEVPQRLITGVLNQAIAPIIKDNEKLQIETFNKYPLKDFSLKWNNKSNCSFEAFRDLLMKTSLELSPADRFNEKLI